MLDAEQICKLERADQIQLSYDVHQAVTKKTDQAATVAEVAASNQSEVQALREDVQELTRVVREMTIAQQRQQRQQHQQQQQRRQNQHHQPHWQRNNYQGGQQRSTDGKPYCKSCGGSHYTNSVVEG